MTLLDQALVERRRTDEELAEKNRERARKSRVKNGGEPKSKSRPRHLIAKYGITDLEYDALLAKQGGGCAACGATSVGVAGQEHLHVDHDHVTGAVRGLLCHGCNVALGLLQDDLQRIEALGAYLRGAYRAFCPTATRVSLE